MHRNLLALAVSELVVSRKQVTKVTHLVWDSSDYTPYRQRPSGLSDWKKKNNKS